MKPFVPILIMAVAAAACSSQTVVTTSTPPGIQALVVDVQDGDSLLVDIGGREERVRLIGINAPERAECFGPESAAGLREIVDGAQVDIVTDVEPRDQYGRLLAYVYLEGTFVNEELARRGFVLARAFEPNTALQERIDDASQEAKDDQQGMWSPDTCASASAASVSIVDIEPNPPGPDEENLNGEWVVIANNGESQIDISGWTLRDASSVHRYVFPAGSRLGPGADLTVFTGCGGDEPGRRYWCADGPVWGNGGDSALLLDIKGLTAATFDY
jgi:endonuclease YncB( thermonuclease family)